MHTEAQRNNPEMSTAARNFETIIGPIVVTQGNEYQNFVGFKVEFKGS